MNNIHFREKQSGMTLIVSMIMLIMITLATVASFTMSRTSLEIVGNMQFNKEGVDAANSAIEEALSTTRMFTTPSTVFLNPCSGANTRCYDFNGDGTNDVTVALNPVPTCVQASTIDSTELDFSLAGDQACLTGEQQCFGIQDCVPAGGVSLCSNSVWEINALATDNASQASLRITQGAAVRVSTANIANSCPPPP